MSKGDTWNSRIDSVKTLAIGGVIGYTFFWLTSHPTKSPLKKRLPEKKIKNVLYFPNIKVTRREKNYWLHHWMNLTLLYFLLLVKKNRFRRSKLAHGFLIGSILQGLLYPDRFHFIDKTMPVQVLEPNEE